MSSDTAGAATQADAVGEGDRFEVTVGAVAHGGHCVARHEGQVIFVRHALPGERVTVEITEVQRGFLRGDAVAVHEASADRVTPGCPYARPDGCGGCDLQHVAPAAQLEWKAAVVREQLVRLGGRTQEEVDALGLRVESLPYDDAAGWRTRVRYRVDAADRPGLLKHRSHEVVPVSRCAIAHPAIQALDVLEHSWPDRDAVDVVAPSAGPAAVVEQPPQRVAETAAGRRFEISAAGFWQVHPAAADTLVAAVLEMLDPRPGEHAWDLYGGAGLFGAALAERVGVTGAVTLVEAAGDGVEAARRNLADLPVRVVAHRVERALRTKISTPDVVVLDPPRSGAGAQVVRDVVAAGPRAVAYVACDPAALGRDVKTFASLGWRLARLRAFDCFPQTHHVECVALLTPPAAG